MPSPDDDFHTFRSRDIELRKTAQFSDAQLIVGNAVWNVHKSIVCLRSGFFNKELSSLFRPGDVKSVTILNHTEEEVRLLLEFIYSGSIAAIHSLKPDDCVHLSLLGEYFQVNGMVSYATKALWLKLTPYLQATSTVPVRRGFRRMGSPYDAKGRNVIFNLEFANAVRTAYEGTEKTCQLVIADFVWAARGWLIRDPMMEQLNTRFPLFGSHVLTALTRGPQSSLVQADGQLMSAANNPAGLFSANYTRTQIEAPSQAKSPFPPFSPSQAKSPFPPFSPSQAKSLFPQFPPTQTKSPFPPFPPKPM